MSTPAAPGLGANAPVAAARAAHPWARVSWATLAAGALVALVLPGVASGPARWLPLAASLLVLGLPHGAVDHHVADRLAPRPADDAGRRRVRIVLAYAVAVLLGLGLWTISPLGTLVLFLVVSAAHWGQGEGWWVVTVAGRAPFGSRTGAAVWASARGGLPIFGAALAHPGEAHAVAQHVVDRLSRSTAVPTLSTSAQVVGLSALGAVVLLAALVSVGDQRRSPRPGALREDLVELVGLSLFFVLVPATWAIGLYFLAWHAPRHVARLVVSCPAQSRLLTEGRHLAALRAFHREALPCSVAALAGLAALAALSAVTSLGTLLAAALALIAALTNPHVAVVAWMDERQGVWSTRAAQAAGDRDDSGR